MNYKASLIIGVEGESFEDAAEEAQSFAKQPDDGIAVWEIQEEESETVMIIAVHPTKGTSVRGIRQYHEVERPWSNEEMD